MHIHIPAPSAGGDPQERGGGEGLSLPCAAKASKAHSGSEKGMKRKKGHATPVQSPAVNAALPTLRGGGLAYRGGGEGGFDGGCVSAGPPLGPQG